MNSKLCEKFIGSKSSQRDDNFLFGFLEQLDETEDHILLFLFKHFNLTWNIDLYNDINQKIQEETHWAGGGNNTRGLMCIT